MAFPSSSPSLLTWAVCDGSAGMAHQVCGLAEAIGYPYIYKKVVRRFPWRYFPASWSWKASRLLTPESDPLDPPYPDLMITCGRRSAALGIDIKRLSAGKTFCVHIQSPKIDPQTLDRIVVMTHDHLRGDNVIVTEWSLHSITPQTLERARIDFSFLGRNPNIPRVAFLIGGDTNRKKMDDPCQHAVLDAIKNIKDHFPRAHFWISASRRTPKKLVRLLQDFGQDNDHIDVFTAPQTEEEGEKSPYLGLLAWADHFVVTNDSVNMMSEVCATGKPLSLIRLPGFKGVPSRFGENLIQKEYARPFDPTTLETWSYPPASSTAHIAQIIRHDLDHHYEVHRLRTPS